MNKQTETVLNYHNRTKHRLERYAKGPESIDWEDQPDQFRHFSGCDIVTLPKPGAELESLFADLDNPETIPAKPLNLANTGLLLELALVCRHGNNTAPAVGHYAATLPAATCTRLKLI